MTFIYLIFSPMTWLLLGIVLLIMEFLDGSFIVFLPSAIGSGSTGIVLKIQNKYFLFGNEFLSSWYEIVLVFACLSVLSIILLRLTLLKFGKFFNNDGNNY